MSIQTACPGCRKSFISPDGTEGRKGKCKSCGATFIVCETDHGSQPVSESEPRSPVSTPTHLETEALPDPEGMDPRLLKILIGGISGVLIVCVIVILSVSSHNKSKKMKERAELADMVTKVVAASQRFKPSEYDRVLDKLSSANEVLRTSGIDIPDSQKKLNAKIVEIRAKKKSYAEKKRAYLAGIVTQVVAEAAQRCLQFEYDLAMDELDYAVEVLRSSSIKVPDSQKKLNAKIVEVREKKEDHDSQVAKKKLAAIVTQVVAEAAQRCLQFEYDLALDDLNNAVEALRSSSFTVSDLQKKLNAKIVEVHEKKEDHDSKVAKGWVHFENRLVPATEKENVLKKRAAEEESRRLAAIEAEEQRELERLADEKQRKREEVAAERKRKHARRKAEQQRERARIAAAILERKNIIDNTFKASVLAYMYNDNEVSADLIFKNYVFYVEGTVENIGKDFLGTMYVSLKGHSFRDVQCFFEDKYESTLASLSSGQMILIKGTCEGLMMNVLMRNCEIVTLP